MKLTFPHMGTLWIPLESLLKGLGHEVVVPPPITERTIALGQRSAPETACFPLKINLGNYLEAFELGADTVIMGGGVGPCRFGYYAEVQREILNDIGCHYEMLVIEPPKGQLSLAWKRFRPLWERAGYRRLIQATRLAWHTTNAVDEVERRVNRIRASEIVPGSATRARQKALARIRGAGDSGELKTALQDALAIIDAVPVDHGRQPLVVALVGEIYTVLEPFASRDIERLLGEMGVWVRRSEYISDWLRHQFFSLLRFDVQKPSRLLGRPFLPCFVGGHGLESVAQTVFHAHNHCDGVVHVLPFTCMPEIVAQTILPTVSRSCEIPVMTLVLDEHSAEAGIITRLEAFVDMLRRRRKKREGLH